MPTGLSQAARLVAAKFDQNGAFHPLIDDGKMVSAIAHRFGFVTTDVVVRPLPDRHRYLPPPREWQTSLSKRMKSESILSFRLAPR